MLITLSGLDGAGKSTIAEWLRSEIERRQGRATVLHLNDHVGIYACLRAIRDRLRGRRDDGPPRMTPHASGLGRLRDAILWNRTLRRALYPVDLLIFLAYRAVLEKLGRRVLIMDRYFYDTLVDVADGDAAGVPGWLAGMTPSPDLAVFLEITPEEAFARKGEYTVQYLRDRDVGYRRVFLSVPAPLRVSARELDTAKEVLARAIAVRLWKPGHAA